MQSIQINATTSIPREEIRNNTWGFAIRRGGKYPVPIVLIITTRSGENYELEEPYDEAAHKAIYASPEQ